MTVNRLTSILLPAAISFLIAACSTPPPSEESSLDSLTEITDTPVRKPIRDVLELGLPEVLNADVEYDEALPNSPDYIDDYLLSEDKAASNLGVYGADALYFSLYSKTQEYIERSSSCQRIALELGVNEAFSPEVIRRLEENIGNSDSIYSILSESIHAADSTLKAGGQERLAALIATGSLVESLYVLCHSLSSPGLSEGNAEKVRQAILKQQTAVGRIKNRIAALSKDKALTDLLEKLGKLEAEIAAAKSKNEPLKGISDLVSSLRGSIIK